MATVRLGLYSAGKLRHGAEWFIEWLKQSGEANRLLERAVSRRRIVAAIAGEV